MARPANTEVEADERAAEALRRAGAAGVHRIAVPTPFAVGRVNTYLIEDRPLTLVDSGPNSAKALDELEQGLAERGVSIADLELLVVTHQHIDHLGLLDVLVRRSGAEVVALDLLAPYIDRYEEDAELDDRFADALMRRHGIPDDLVTALRAVSLAFRGWGSRAGVDRVLTDGDRLTFEGRSLEVLHRPGHSPTDTLFWDAETRILLCGDHLLEHISSNPLVSRAPGANPDPAERTQALVTYMASMRETQAMPVDIALGGHGPPVTEHASLIADRLRMHERRAERIYAMLERQPLSAHEIAQSLWGNVAVTQAFLTLSEVLGHVDLLLNAGRVREVEGEPVRFAVTG